MSDSWTPIFSSIINSSIWRESKETRLVWITMLAKKDKDGVVHSALWALARDAGVSEEECREAIKVLESPDPNSASKDYAGRRIEAIDGGWVVLNHFVYRDRISLATRRARQAEWQKAYRARQAALKKGQCLAGLIKERVNNDPITKADESAKP